MATVQIRWFTGSRPTGLTTLVTLAILAVAGNVAAAPPPNRQVNDPTGEPVFATQVNPVIRSLGDKVVAVWNDAQTSNLTGSEQRMQYAVSVDSGLTFTDLGTVPAPTAPITWRWRNDAQLGVDPATGAFWAAGQVQSTTSSRMGIAVVRGTFTGSAFSWGTPILLRDFPNATAVRFPVFAFEVEPQYGDLHYLFCNYYEGAAAMVEHWRSTDGGASWFALFISNPLDNGAVQAPRLAPGIDGDMHAAWLGAGTPPYRPIRYRRYVRAFADWRPEETPATGVFNALAIGGLAPISGFPVARRFSLAVNRIAGSDAVGRPVICWSESWDYGDESFTPLTSSPFVVESENNDTPATADPFVLGDVLRGASSKASDSDWWQVSLSAGQALVAWPDSVSPLASFSIAIYAPGGTTMHGTMVPGGDAAAFRAPVAGTYFISVTPFNTTTYYRVRTRTSSVGVGEARDHRDIAVVHRTATGWSPTRRLSYSPSGYDDHLPEIGWGADGLDYLTWYDLGLLASESRSHLVVARNVAGDDPVISPPQIVTTQSSRWDSLFVILSLGTGHWNSVSSDDRRVHLGWADLRRGNADVLATTLSTVVAAGACPGPANGPPTANVPISIGLTNHNPLFEEKCSIQVIGSRSWPSMVVRDSVPPATAGTLDVAVAIPDTAAQGVNTLTITVKRQSGLPVTTCVVPLTVTSQTGVDEGGGIAFALHPPFPNPARRTVSLAYDLHSGGRVRLEILGIRGERVRTLLDADRPAGPGTVVWDGRDPANREVPAGLYFVRLAAAGRVATQRVLIMK